MSSFASGPSIQSLLSQLDRSAGCLKIKDGMRGFDRWLYTVENPTIRTRAGCRVAILEKSALAEKHNNNSKPVHSDLRGSTAYTTAQHAKSRALYSFILTFSGRILILVAHVGVLLLAVVYTQNTDINGFETFLDSETIGVRIFFPSTGVAPTPAWTAFFQGEVSLKSCRRLPGANTVIIPPGVAWASPYRVARRARDPSPPTNPPSGLYRVLPGRHPDAYLGVVPLVSVPAHMLPPLLVNVPYRVIDTYLFRQSRPWLVVAVVAGMICTVLGSFVDFPHIPADPSTIVGAMYYATAGKMDERNVSQAETE